jgi:hypothetical protein
LYCCEHCSRHEPADPSKAAGHPTHTVQPMGPR